MKVNKNKFLWWSIGTLSIVGIILATYLLYSFYNPKPKLVCDINEKVNCQAVTSGSLATFAGVPIAMVGLTGYAVLLFSGVTKRKRLAFWTSTFGMVFCLRLTILEVFYLKVICPICLVCQTAMLLIFAISIYLNFIEKGKSAKEK